MMETYKNIALRLFVFITDSARAPKAEGILRRSGIPIQLRFQGKGTVTGDMMSYLGLDGVDKTIYICFLPKAAAAKLLDTLNDQLQLNKPGRGIAFVLPINGVSSLVFKLLDTQVRKDILNKTESEVRQMTENSNYSLILAVANQGYSEEVMETARSAGATGGTVFHARRLGMEEAMKFWGVSVQGEREIIAILATKESRADIMRAIGEKHGMHSETQGLILSIPVDQVAGI